MTDLRYQKLAKLLVNYSTQVKKGDCALLDLIDVPDEFSIELMRAVRAAGGTPLVEIRHTRISRELLLKMTGRQAALARDLELCRMKKMQVYIAIRGLPTGHFEQEFARNARMADFDQRRAAGGMNSAHHFNGKFVGHINQVQQRAVALFDLGGIIHEQFRQFLVTQIGHNPSRLTGQTALSSGVIATC